MENPITKEYLGMLAVFLARWLDVRLSAWCDAIIEDILTKKAELTITQPETSATVQVTQGAAIADLCVC